MITSAEIREQFFEFFRARGHQILPSAPIVVKNDPTLMFTNAGMNQFKDYFLGNKKPAHKRVANTQKCLRVSGKHNDLEEVGVDTYHHTMFEMLGNWSFGDYFKKEAIAWSWELLTGVYKISPDRLYVTVFAGDDNEGLPTDEEAIAEWKKHVASERILAFGKKDNFWEMGDTGPCGPCTEIHVDCRSDEERKQVDGIALVNKDHPQVIEIWNNVFIQFNRLKDGNLEPLPAKHVDTGMGLERLVRVLQQKDSNYDTDLFTGILAETEKIVGKKYTPSAGHSREAVAFRVIADHVRAIAFTIADGQLPSNTGAGYVIRRILRRAVRYYFSYLNYKQPLLYQLIPCLATQFEKVFPELIKQKDSIQEIVKKEEAAFLRTVEKGLAMLNTIREDINGETAFKLYDTYGFPLDLTKLVAAEKGLKVDEAGFEAEMKKQQTRSRENQELDTEDWIVLKEGTNRFVGYDSLETKTQILKYRKVKTKGKEFYQLVLESTPFYAEAGGQVGDSGWLETGHTKLFISDTKKENELIIHFTDRVPEKTNGKVFVKVDAVRRKNIMLHHTATHLLHAALRKILGAHVQQKGSLVNAEHLRFDFSHFAKMSEEEMEKVEAMVNEKIRENIPVVVKEMPKEEAMQMGAMALFGEKYGEIVRVVIIDPAYSVELCGGTHAGATGELGFFKIIHETAIAAGVRRIEAVCGKKAEQYVNDQLNVLQALKEQLKNPADILKSIQILSEENSALKKHIEALEARRLVAIRNELLQKDEIIGQVNFIGEIVEVSSPDSLKKICFDLRNNLRDYLVVLCANIGGKPHVAVSIADTVVSAKGLDANKIIKEQVAPLIKGGGGGQKNLATAGGQDASNLKEVIHNIKLLLGK